MSRTRTPSNWPSVRDSMLAKTRSDFLRFVRARRKFLAAKVRFVRQAPKDSSPPSLPSSTTCSETLCVQLPQALVGEVRQRLSRHFQEAKERVREKEAFDVRTNATWARIHSYVRWTLKKAGLEEKHPVVRRHRAYARACERCWSKSERGELLTRAKASCLR